MRLGYVTPNSWGLDHPGQVVELAALAESLGAASLWVSHHVVHRGFIAERLGTKPYHDPLVMLSAFAGATNTARLGTSVLVLPYLHPMPTAKALATIDHVSNGRLDFGVGVGNLRAEHDAIGQTPFEQRGAYANEFLEVLQRLWSETPSSFSGRFFSFEDLDAHPGPFQSSGIPIFVGGHGRAAIQRAARFGAGWQGLGIEPELVTAELDAVSAAFAAAGRSFNELPFQVRLHIPIEDMDVDSWKRRFDAYEAVGVTDLLLAPQSGDFEMHRRWLDALVPTLSGR
ncbi:MAG TPA: TIGR03619 family F420-dependent LLM class oxidoreductase [Acidimicrobiales bacterium]|nr:TIGR03619 family F420-dependent LLM class oxidoreductase [Acidimicrobiales bacterium]